MEAAPTRRIDQNFMLKDPLFHFALLGALIFGAWYALNPTDPTDDPRTIVVDRNALLTFIQYRTRSFDEAEAARKFDAWPKPIVDDLVNDFIREEALYRSAREMGLDADDYVMRQRMVQKVEFMAEGVTEQVEAPDEVVLEAWYGEHKQDYTRPAAITFTHVFYSAERHTSAGAKDEATKTLTFLNHEHIPFDAAPSHGDRFPYHVNYVDRSEEEIVSHFGEAMATQLFALTPSDTLWQGPIESPHGAHVVLLTKHTSSRTPDLKEVRDQVLLDWMAQTTRARKEAFIERVLADFKVIRSPDLQIKPSE